MGCWLLLGAILLPRILLIVWWFQDKLIETFETTLWPVLGFLFMPITTCYYAWNMTWGPHAFEGKYLILLIITIVLDLSSGGSSGSRANSRGRKSS
jgi:hypothetical protein